MYLTQSVIYLPARNAPRAAAVLAGEAAGEGWSGLERYETIMREMREQLHTMTARLAQLMVSTAAR